ncbi:MAG TPA: hypothetical protein VFG33_28795 [Kribbella sp.]|uniref:hypothetical protein n=1 Tax=Kribbella sp. TaxID=1871183 RepID=UPI002D7A2FFD|nr:hypothetical protein [Kribbella sp.]HET6297416.1 hypothetical protein [Kribbella sp.]
MNTLRSKAMFASAMRRATGRSRSRADACDTSTPLNRATADQSGATRFTPLDDPASAPSYSLIGW